MNPSPPADYVVEALLAFFPANEPKFTTNVEKIHRAFCWLKEQYAEAMGDFFFDNDKPFPFCEDIEFAFGNLAAAGLVRTQNTYLEKFNTSPELVSHYERVTKARVGIAEANLRRISEKLQEALAES